jgi:hypothetical protein
VRGDEIDNLVRAMLARLAYKLAKGCVFNIHILIKIYIISAYFDTLWCFILSHFFKFLSNYYLFEYIFISFKF